jgi:hypothetical protein
MCLDETSRLARQRMEAYLVLARAYTQVWGLAPDRAVFLNLWAQARKEAT